MNKAIQSLFLITTFSGIVLSSSIVSADDNTSVVDEINITVPVSCTISGTGMNTHNVNINNGLYEDDIGTTTLHAFCNDNEGFAIYAAGYTGNEVGGENSNKLVGTNASNNATIESGTATTAGNPDISNWAMKLQITQDSGDTTGTNAFTIDSAPNVSLPSQAEQSATSTPFSQYHVVPNEYTKVAHKNSNTDMAESTGGVKLTTTYAAYISKTQPADTYSGQVIYTLVHPSSAAAPGGGINVVYNSGEHQFPGGATTNVVKYAEDCSDATHIASAPLIAKSSNVTNDGVKDYSYAFDARDVVPITAAGATKMKVIVKYGVSSGTWLMVTSGVWDGQSEPLSYEGVSDGNQNTSGTKTYVFDGDSITMFMASYGVTPAVGYDYGFWAQVYPIYSTEPVGVDTAIVCPYIVSSGVYTEPNQFGGSWYLDNGGDREYFYNETEVKEYLSDNKDSMSTDTINLYAYGLIMQHVSRWKNKLVLEQQAETIDIRDGKTYMVAKQADGNIWMTQNLDLCIGCEGTASLTSENTDLNVAGIGIYADGYSNSNDVITWVPSSNTVDPMDSWTYSDYEPRSVDIGDYYVYTSGSDDNDVVYNSESDCNLVHNDGTCPHYHIGNYYNRAAAFASNNTLGIMNYGTMADNSICPAGWRLPRRYGNVDDFMALLDESGIIDGYSADPYYIAWGNYANNGFNSIRTAPLFFVRADAIMGFPNLGVNGYYHTSIANGDTVGRYLRLEKYSQIYVRDRLDDGDSGFGMSIRCLAADE